MSKMESYLKILDTLLLRNILDFLPTKERLSSRLVNKDFEDAAAHVLRHGDMTIDVQGLRLSDFIVEFGLGPSPNRLLSRAKVVFLPGSNSQRRLEVFGLKFGPAIRNICLNLTHPHTDHPNVLSRVIGLVNCCVKLTKIKIDKVGTRELNLDTVPETEVTEVIDLPHLREFNFTIALTQLDLIYKILQKAPHISQVCARIISTYRTIGFAMNFERAPTCTSDFFRRIGQIPNMVYLDVEVVLPDRAHESTLFNSLLTSDVSPQKLKICIHEGARSNLDDKTNLCDWLSRLTSGSTLKKLAFRSTKRQGSEVFLPASMNHLKLLDLGKRGTDTRSQLSYLFTMGYVKPNQRLTSAQIPSVEEIVQTSGDEDETLLSTEVYLNVKHLIVKSKIYRGFRLFGPSPVSSSWPQIFPNLSKLDTYVSSVGGEESLRTIFAKMLNLTYLKINFDENFQRNGTHGLWNVFTGSLQPEFKSNRWGLAYDPNPSEILMPLPPGEEIDDIGEAAAIYRLRSLKTLVLQGFPASVLLAVVRLTAVSKLVRLEKLKLISDKYCQGFSANLHPNVIPVAYITVLQQYHSSVTISNTEDKE